MAVALPHFAEFDVHSDGAVGIRWKKWLTRFKNLLLAVDVDDTKRQRALLLHYAGVSVNEIFETLPNTEAGEYEDPFEKAATALTNYFTSKKNREYVVYVFRKAKQENGENISAFHTRLRQLAINGEFADNDREIKTQIVQNCLSHKLRMKALQNPELTLTQLLDAGKAMEMSKSQAETIEEKQNINKLSRKYTRRASNQNGGHVDRNSDGAKTADRNSVPGESGKCRNCGKGYPHPGGKTSCPAYGKSCRGCGKQNHYEAVCRSKKPNKKQEFKTQKPRHNVQNLVDENSNSEDSDEDGYAFSVNSTGKEQSQPMFNIVIHDTPMRKTTKPYPSVPSFKQQR
jgi:hypothetical protein